MAIVALIALPVGVVACGLAVHTSTEVTGDRLHVQELGRADLVVGTPEGDHIAEDADGTGAAQATGAPDDAAAVERALRAALPEGSRLVPYRRAELEVSSGERASNSFVVATDARDRMHDGRYRVERGRLPARAGEAALSLAIARQLDVGVGDRITLYPGEAELEVVGMARATNALRDGVVLVPTSTVATTGWWVDLPAGADAPAAARALRDAQGLDGVPVRTADGVLQTSGLAQRLARATLWYVAGALGLAWTGVVAAATFAIGARSRLREVGLVAAAGGGSRRQVRGLLLADGLVLGLLGSVLGLAVGIPLGVPVAGALARSASHEYGPFQVPVLAELGLLVLGTAAAVLAARWPAARAARLPTLAALQGRIGRPPHPGRSTVGGAAAMGAGALLLTSGAAAGTKDLVAAGTVLVVAGVAMLHRLAVDGVARLAGRAPLALRFAARDASRQASRTGPAVVASMLALAAAVGGATLTATVAARDDSGDIWALYPEGQFEVMVDGGAALTPDRDGPALARAISGALDAPTGATWWATARPDTGLVDLSDMGSTDGVNVATPEMLALLGITDERALEVLRQGGVVRPEATGTSDPPGTDPTPSPATGTIGSPTTPSEDMDPASSPTTVTAADGRRHQLPAVDVTGVAARRLAGLTVSPETASRLGLNHTSSLLVLVDLGRPVRQDDLVRAHAAALPVTRGEATIDAIGVSGRSDRTLLTVAVALGLGVALPVFVLVAALTRSEARGELAILDAVGIAPLSRRRLTAAGTGLVASVASLLALPAGLIPAVLYLQADGPGAPGEPSVTVPWLAVALLVLSAPLALTLTGWLTAGQPRPLAAFRR
jgi:putative ABC transport system permease protein